MLSNWPQIHLLQDHLYERGHVCPMFWHSKPEKCFHADLYTSHTVSDLSRAGHVLHQKANNNVTRRKGTRSFWFAWRGNVFGPSIALWNKSNGSYDIKDFGTLPLIFSTSKYFRRKFQPCPSFFSHPNIPDKWKRLPLSLDQMKKKEKVKVKS